MTDISERGVVHCPDPYALDYLSAFVADHRRGAGRPRNPLTERSNSAYRLKSTGNPHPTYFVTWSPRDGNRFASFTGVLTVVQSSGKDCFDLILNARCTLRDVAGATCDAASDRRIARLSVRNLLRIITEYIENARAHNEAALAGHKHLTYLSVTRAQRRLDTV